MRRGLVLVVLAGVFVLPGGVARAGGGCVNPAPTESSGTTIEYTDFCPTPTILHVRVGQTVTWRNEDGTDHTVTSGLGFWANETLAPQQTFTHRFDEAGSYVYYCMIHPGMAGTVVVGDTTSTQPVAATTSSDPRSSDGGWIALAGALGLVFGITTAGVAGRRKTSRANGSVAQ